MAWALRKFGAYLALLTCTVLTAQTPDPTMSSMPRQLSRPVLDAAPADQNWSFLAGAPGERDTFDCTKYVRIGNASERYLSLGLEIRMEYEVFWQYAFGAGKQDQNGYLLTRVMPHADLHLNRNVRFFTELKMNELTGRNGGPRPSVDQDVADVHQFFLDLGTRAATPTHGWGLRTGRQEIVLGTGRIFDDNEGPNVKLSLDGIRLFTAVRKAELTIFGIRPVIENTSSFDDVPRHNQSVAGVYGTTPFPLFPNGKADIYAIFDDTKSATYARGSGREQRGTLGVRVFRNFGKGWDYNWEPNLQVGSFKGTVIRAWSISSETGYTFSGSRAVRPLVRIDAFSGDGGNAVKPLGTYNPLFPRGAYFSPKLTPAFSPQNLFDLHPVVQIRVRDNITSAVSWAWDWRQKTGDSMYSYGGAQPSTQARTSGRFLGQQGDAEVRWSPASHTILALNLFGVLPGTYIRNGSSNHPVVAANLGVTYRF